MPEYLAPGVYVEETSSAPGLITATTTSIAAIVGTTVKGPLDTPTEVRSFADYKEIFGPVSEASPTSMAVLHFFSNGGRRAVVVRVAAGTTRGPTRVAPTDMIGDAGKETGVHALGKRPVADVLLTPDAAGMSWREHEKLAKAILPLCEEHGIFYILDPPRAPSKQNPVEAVIDWAERSETLRHPNAAVYFPRVRTSDPSGAAEPILAPASGAVAGIYARTDAQHGVWQAPAGTRARLLGIKGLEVDLAESQRERLQHVCVNPLCSFPGLGILAWGARTFMAPKPDSEWKYVPVRRLYLFLERSLDRGLQWTVFEPNGEPLWAQIRLSVSSFMNHLFRRGAFAGTSSREAYFVKCGRETMTEAGICNGRVVLLVGFAPLKPAEFVILRLVLQTAESS